MKGGEAVGWVGQMWRVNREGHDTTVAGHVLDSGKTAD